MKKELPKVKGKVKTRIAPEPSKYMHIGHALIFLINYKYAKEDNGSCILRLEDTNPGKVSEEYAKSMLEDLKWLKIKYDEKIVCSERMKIYYEYAEKLIKLGKAYVCFCSRDQIQSFRGQKIKCACADKDVKKNFEQWKGMLNKEYKPGEANLRLVGDINSDNGVLRDPIIFKLTDEKHYLQGNKYYVWPLYDFENSVEDSIEGVSHVIRSKEFELRAELQDLIKDYLKLKKQEVIEIGRFNISGAITQGREIRELIEKKMVLGWDDPRLVTIKALRRRGFVPEAFHDLAVEVGLSKAETNIDVRVLSSINRKLIDKKVKRYFFVENPVKIKIKDIPKLKIEAPLHPEVPKFGVRKFEIKDEFFIQDKLEKGNLYRLMHGFNFKDGKFVSEEYDKTLKAKLIHWVPTNDYVSVEILMDDGSVKKGVAESNVKNIKAGETVQFERFAFVRCEGKNKFIYLHK